MYGMHVSSHTERKLRKSSKNLSKSMDSGSKMIEDVHRENYPTGGTITERLVRFVKQTWSGMKDTEEGTGKHFLSK